MGNQLNSSAVEGEEGREVMDIIADGGDGVQSTQQKYSWWDIAPGPNSPSGQAVHKAPKVSILVHCCRQGHKIMSTIQAFVWPIHDERSLKMQ
jgi:hypothetical protein